jgi:hypothetical protein
LLCALGWYGVSGERYTARQVPYLTSATAPGVALIVGGTVLLAAQRRNLIASNELERLSRQLEVLCQLLTEAAQNETAAESGAATGPGPGAAGDGGSVRPWLLAVPGGRTYHRFDCLLVQGRRDPERVMNGSAAAQGLRPCPLCEPPEA